MLLDYKCEPPLTLTIFFANQNHLNKYAIEFLEAWYTMFSIFSRFTLISPLQQVFPLLMASVTVSVTHPKRCLGFYDLFAALG